MKREELGITAFNNRLEKLIGLGLVRRAKLGKKWTYFLTTKKGTK